MVDYAACWWSFRQRCAARDAAAANRKKRPRRVYQCQFIDCGNGMDLMAKRGNNLNSWINCLFAGNTQAAIRMANNDASLFANCDFINNGGNPVVQNNRRVPFVSCRFEAGALGRGGMLADQSSAEGCRFERGASATATIVSRGSRSFFYNCSSLDMPVGSLAEGLLFNNGFSLDPALNQQGVIVKAGAAKTFLPGTPAPRPQLLTGRAFPK